MFITSSLNVSEYMLEPTYLYAMHVPYTHGKELESN